jgi:hypothetical protein
MEINDILEKMRAELRVVIGEAGDRGYVLK